MFKFDLFETEERDMMFTELPWKGDEWTLDSISCDNEVHSVDMETQSVKLSLNAGDEVTCVFVNVYEEQVHPECLLPNILLNGDFEAVDSRVGVQNGATLDSLAGSNGWDLYSSLPDVSYGSGTSWYASGDMSVEIQANTVVPAQSGNHYMEMDTHGGSSNTLVGQELNLGGGNYELSFWYRPRTEAVGDNTVHVIFAGSTESLLYTADGTAPSDWTHITVPFSSDAGPAKLLFQAGGFENSLGGFIDNVSLSCASDNDADDDGVIDDEDNCPYVYNPDQADADEDGIGDACEEPVDSDEDGVPDDEDNCPDVYNPDQLDTDEDGIGDACEEATDTDEDGVPDQEDNCPLVPNPDQLDSDEDGIGDACEEEGSSGGGDQGRSDIQGDSGSHRGHRSNEARGKMAAVANSYGLNAQSLPPGGFGGTDDEIPFNEQEIAYICSMQRALPIGTMGEVIKVMAGEMSQYLGRSATMIADALTDPFICADINLSLRQPTTVQTVEAPPKAIFVDSRGVPMSQNKTFEACVEAYLFGVTPDLFTMIKENSDVNPTTGRPYSCDQYNKVSDGQLLWIWPDAVNETAYIDIKKEGSKVVLTASKGYTVKNAPASVATN